MNKPYLKYTLFTAEMKVPDANYFEYYEHEDELPATCRRERGGIRT